jgi:hypothetical protein
VSLAYVNILLQHSGERLCKFHGTYCRIFCISAEVRTDNIINAYVKVEAFTAMTMKNAFFWDIETQFVPHRKYFTSPLQNPAG